MLWNKLILKGYPEERKTKFFYPIATFNAFYLILKVVCFMMGILSFFEWKIVSFLGAVTFWLVARIDLLMIMISAALFLRYGRER